jgi:hypothetical protein
LYTDDFTAMARKDARDVNILENKLSPPEKGNFYDENVKQQI